MSGEAVVVEGVDKSFGRVDALVDLSLRVPEGRVLGLLGPNGAGKTTLVRVLTTLLRPDRGRAEVAGFDVVREAAQVRTAIGLAGQYAAVDANLTGRENLQMVGRLYHLGGREARRRAGALLERFDLEEAAGRPARGYSGGMRRRLDLAASLVGHPTVLFLDEPTTGLDPPSRHALWGVIEELASEGTTVLLTTQYLEEADHLADTIAVIDCGRVIAEGSGEELKARVGGERLEVRVSDGCRVEDAAAALEAVATGEPERHEPEGRLLVPVRSSPELIAEVVRRLDSAGVGIADVGYRRPTLDDVFAALTGQGRRDGDQPASVDPDVGDPDAGGSAVVAGERQTA